MPKKSRIGELASAATTREFADQLSSCTTMTAEEIKLLFPKKTDREEMVELLRIVNSAADENSRKAELIQRIDTVSGAVLKVVGKITGGL